jgi:hypothetical protein
VTTLTRAYACNDEQRRAALQKHATLMGIDYLEVSEDQRELSIYFVPGEDEEKTVIPEDLTPPNVEITGGVRIPGVRVTGIRHEPDRLVVEVEGDPESGVGDFSTYTLSLVNVSHLDPLFSQVAFSFKVGCPTEFDCKPKGECPEEPPSEPEID